MASVIKGVSECQTLISLNLSNNDLGSDSYIFQAFLPLLKSPYLQELCLSNNQISDKGIEEIA
jgi:Leucine-rich repeat (LRR) protein